MEETLSNSLSANNNSIKIPVRELRKRFGYSSEEMGSKNYQLEFDFVYSLTSSL